MDLTISTYPSDLGSASLHQNLKLLFGFNQVVDQLKKLQLFEIEFEGYAIVEHSNYQSPFSLLLGKHQIFWKYQSKCCFEHWHSEN
jgi:hypothetical protein